MLTLLWLGVRYALHMILRDQGLQLKNHGQTLTYHPVLFFNHPLLHPSAHQPISPAVQDCAADPLLASRAPSGALERDLGCWDGGLCRHAAAACVAASHCSGGRSWEFAKKVAMFGQISDNCT